MTRPSPPVTEQSVEQSAGVPASPSGCQPSASAASSTASSQSGIPNASMLRSYLLGMAKQGEDRIWRGAETALAVLDGMESQLAYLRGHHEIAEHMLGVVSLNASPELMRKLRPYSNELQTLWINRLLDLGVPAERIGQHAMFNADDVLVASAIEARRAATENTDAVHESATGEAGDAQGDAHD